MKSKEEKASSHDEERPYLGIMFDCCGVYNRVYRKLDENEYQGRCPKCLRTCKIRVDQASGVSSRFFKAF